MFRPGKTEYAHVDTELKRRAIEKVSSDICNVCTDVIVPDSFDEETLMCLCGLRYNVGVGIADCMPDLLVSYWSL